MELLKDVVAKWDSALNPEDYGTSGGLPDPDNPDFVTNYGVMAFITSFNDVYWRYCSDDPETLGLYQQAVFGMNTARVIDSEMIDELEEEGCTFYHVLG